MRYYYEIHFHFYEDERHIILSHSKKYDTHEFWKMCNKFFHQFPKNPRTVTVGGEEKTWYSWSEYDCLEYVKEKLCEEYGFRPVEVTAYYLGEDIDDVRRKVVR